MDDANKKKTTGNRAGIPLKPHQKVITGLRKTPSTQNVPKGSLGKPGKY